MKKTPAPVVWPFPSRAEAAVVEDFVRVFRAAGEDEAWRLLDRLGAASDTGADQGVLSDMLRDAVAALPVKH